MEEVGRRLRLLRKGRGLPQREVADRLGMARATLSNYEVGRRSPGIEELRRLAEFYGVGLDYFGLSDGEGTLELLERARAVFSSELPKEDKDRLYKELMRLYLELS